MSEKSGNGEAQSIRSAIEASAANERNRRMAAGEKNVPSQQAQERITRQSVINDEKRRERK